MSFGVFLETIVNWKNLLSSIYGRTFFDENSERLKAENYFHKNVRSYPVGIYLFKVNNRNTRTRCEICLKLAIKTPEGRHWRFSGVFIVNFEQISHVVLVFLLLSLSR